MAPTAGEWGRCAVVSVHDASFVRYTRFLVILEMWSLTRTYSTLRFLTAPQMHFAPSPGQSGSCGMASAIAASIDT